jgi:hypothetical protein
VKTDNRAASDWNRRWRASHQIMVSTAMVRIFVADRANHRKFVRNLSKIWDHFAEVNPRNSGRDRLELAANVDRRIRLRIESLIMGRAAIKPYQDTIHMTCGNPSHLRGTGAKAQQFGKPKTAKRAESELNEITATDSVAFLWCVHGFNG